MYSTTMSPITIDKSKPKAIAYEGLSERAMIVQLHLHMWDGQVTDRQVTAEVLQERKAAADAGRFIKYLVPEAALEPIERVHNAARAMHKRLTLPWDDDSSRILAASAFFEYSSKMQEERVHCEQAYRTFLAAYPRYKQEGLQRMGALYDAGAFPDERAIKSKFGMELITMPVPTRDDFRVDLGTEMQERIKDDIERTVTERFATAQRELWERLLSTVQTFARSLREKDETKGKRRAPIHDSTVEKLGDLARLAPKLSLKPDPVLEKICSEIADLTSGLTATDLRKSPVLRRASAVKAREALERIEQSMAGAFGS